MQSSKLSSKNSNLKVKVTPSNINQIETNRFFSSTLRSNIKLNEGEFYIKQEKEKKIDLETQTQSRRLFKNIGNNHISSPFHNDSQTEIIEKPYKTSKRIIQIEDNLKNFTTKNENFFLNNKQFGKKQRVITVNRKVDSKGSISHIGSIGNMGSINQLKDRNNKENSVLRNVNSISCSKVRFEKEIYSNPFTKIELIDKKIGKKIIKDKSQYYSCHLNKNFVPKNSNIHSNSHNRTSSVN